MYICTVAEIQPLHCMIICLTLRHLGTRPGISFSSNLNMLVLLENDIIVVQA